MVYQNLRLPKFQIILIDFNCSYAMYRPDVKLWQCMTLMREVEQIAVARDVAVIVCGDFNR